MPLTLRAGPTPQVLPSLTTPNQKQTEDDGDADVDRNRADTSLKNTENPQNSPHTRRSVGIASDSPPTTTTGVSLEVNADSHIIINNSPTHGLNEVGVEDGIVSLEPNDDFAMGVPPGALGAVEGPAPTTTPADLETRDETQAGSTRRHSKGCHYRLTCNNTGHDCSSRHPQSP